MARTSSIMRPGALRVRALDEPAALLRLAVAALAGVLLATAFAPLEWWPLALVCPAVLIALWQGATPGRAAAYGFLFNAGTFTAGTYWLYISIHGFGQAPLWVALGLMAGLVGIMALYGAALGYLIALYAPATGALRWMAAIPAAWVIVEWFRGWFLTGFAWLSVGYTQSDTWLSGFAPVFGVYGLTALLLVGAGALVTLVRGSPRERAAAVLALIVPWGIAWPLSHIDWTRAAGKAVSVAIVQGAIPQDEKWQESHHASSLMLYRDLTRQTLGAAVIVWPEAATADLASNLTGYLAGLARIAREHGSTLVLGTLRADAADHYYNSVLSLGGPETGWYDKRHLVPFAEFFPVPQFVRDWLRLMSLPYSDFTRGAADQPPLHADGLELATTVCYEDAYGSYELATLRRADVLVNVTNDAWFGHSSARYQHLQIARMRALEAGRYMLRAANDGISAVIGPHGQVLAIAPQYRPIVLRATITPLIGLTPYAVVGNWLIISLGATTLLLVVGWPRLARHRQRVGRSRPALGTGTPDAG